ncbi:MAG: glycoside hydrolase family 127 protein [Acidobacteriaceae bacterium]|nr:glycoside hydrolase family 127 protein [Acidobacteriaceae bacterium]
MITRRSFLQSASTIVSAGAVLARDGKAPALLEEFRYSDVELAPGLAQTQFEQTQAVLLGLNDDALLKPWRLRAGLPAPGPELGGWYDEVPLDKTPSGGHGFAPAHCFGQWLSALARGYDANRDVAKRAKLQKLLALYEPAISARFYTNFRFPAYDYDKMVIGLIDAHQFADVPDAFRLLELTTNAAEPHLPPHALDRDEPQREWRKSRGENTANDYTWDESYTIAENLYLAWERGAGDRYRTLARRFLLDRTYFDPLSEGRNVLPNHHAYSFCNALSSAMQAYIADASEKHLRAASNAFDMITTTQSFATGGWGPNESFVVPDSGKLYDSLNQTHAAFETPCGSYAHFKLTRYLLRVTHSGRYGDSMERVLYNTVLGAKRLEPDGTAFYYSDYHLPASKTYFPDKWPCCSGTLPQVAADYRILIYFRDNGGILVNLYLPSTLRWTSKDGAQLSLTQRGNYPLEGDVGMQLRASRPSDFSLRLRIPAWSTGTTIRVNGQPVPMHVELGFATIRRQWHDGDRIDMTIPLPVRLEPIDSQHPNTVALLRGPLVLFAITDTPPKLTRQQLLAETRAAAEPVWRASTASGSLLLRPFTAIQDETYLAYLTRGS